MDFRHRLAGKHADMDFVTILKFTVQYGQAAVLTAIRKAQLSNHHSVEAVRFHLNPGTGKTHLATALGLKACEKGLRVRFYTAAGLVNDLLEAQQNRTISKLEQQLGKLHLLILDELSYLTFARPSAELLFQVLSSRNERGSVIITTNLELSRWTEIFGIRCSRLP
jgi:DNA replication protein DnaC